MEENNANNSCCCNPRHKIVLVILGIIVIGTIIVISIIRERIVNPTQNQVTVMGQGKISYSPDEANVTLGMQVDKAPTAEEALRQLNDKMNKIVLAVKALGIKEEDIKTETYNVYPQYDYKDGSTNVSGYNARQSLVVKIKSVDQDKEITGKVVSAASNAGANNISNISYSVSDINNFKQKARLAAIEDAKTKSTALFKAAGVRPGKVVGWYENNVSAPDQPNYGVSEGMGGSLTAKSAPVPQVPSGTQEIIIEIGLNYEVK